MTVFLYKAVILGHAWIRDNVYVIHSLWALYRAYMKCAEFDEDITKANELGLTW